MKKYRDGDDGYDIIRPGERMPTEYTGPAERGDFAWVRPTLPARWRGVRIGKTLKILNDNLGQEIQYNEQTAAFVRTKHAIVEAHDEERLLPLKFEQKQATLQLSIVKTLGAIKDEMERGERERLEHKRQMAELKSRDKQAKRARRRARDAERRRSFDQPQRPPTGGGAAAFHRHYRTMEEVRANLSEGESRLQEIYGRAAARRRNLTDDEMMEVDAIQDAMRAAKDEVIRTGASDLEAADD